MWSNSTDVEVSRKGFEYSTSVSFNVIPKLMLPLSGTIDFLLDGVGNGGTSFEKSEWFYLTCLIGNMSLGMTLNDTEAEYSKLFLDTSTSVEFDHIGGNAFAFIYLL